ncbi:cell wall metabolism sensor histidine kinase WalK [Actinomadura sp. WMMB 499]|uniref:sensor histidine kinase n=1 Tax=Actinomadura sp. WMMB 499 TaxID=1219491 RepID=UPI001245F311|nr:HAMP domain-containing sensor histidine kinase [Actinomadura sp. WMMB 499]QFG23081.1 HAMP domain-containing histidine kinase [Actinomadura sp. WMMB 499]
MAAGEPDVLPVARFDVEDPDRPGEFQVRYWSAITAPLLDADGNVVLLIHHTKDVTAFVDHLRGRHPSDTAHPPAGHEAVEAELYVRAQQVREVNERLRAVQATERRAAAELRETVRRQEREVADTRREAAASRQEVADASYDLRNPLTGLRTRLEAALADPEADSRQVLHAALDDAQRLGDIVSDLLELARLDAGSPVRTEPIDLAVLVREILAGQSCRHAVAARLDRPAVVRGSRSRLVRLVANLPANADRHAREAIEVSMATDGGDAVLDVTDDGTGIPPDEREAVFRRFYRRPDARRADPDGTGLGLSIARQTALAHHGTLHVADRPAGTRMVLRVPLDTEAG